MPTLISLLRDRRAKSDARDVLIGYGEEVVDALAFFLNDTDEDPWVRRHIHATLARIPCQKSMDALVAVLQNERDGFVRFKLVSAIDRLHQAAAALADVAATAVVHGTLLAIAAAVIAATALRRARPAAHAALWLVVLLKFVVPFLVMIPRGAKRTAGRLVPVAILILIAQFL